MFHVEHLRIIFPCGAVYSGKLRPAFIISPAYGVEIMKIGIILLKGTFNELYS